MLQQFRNIVERMKRWYRRPKSNLVEHAKREMEIAKLGGTLYDGMLPEAVLEIIKVFSKQGHSGMSASIVTSVVEKLMRFEPLSPLTGENEEWNEVGEGMYQNRRCSHVFKNGEGAYDIQGKVFRDPDGGCYTNGKSHVPVIFPYIPETEYVDVKE